MFETDWFEIGLTYPVEQKQYNRTLDEMSLISNVCIHVCRDGGLGHKYTYNSRCGVSRCGVSVYPVYHATRKGISHEPLAPANQQKQRRLHATDQSPRTGMQRRSRKDETSMREEKLGYKIRKSTTSRTSNAHV
jgi:hypothetical protein